MNKKVLSSLVLTLSILLASLGFNATPVNAEVVVTGITLDKSNVTLEKGGFTYITAKTDPKKATNRKVRYKSLDSSVASVTAKGKITGKAVGETYIAASTVDGGYMKFCKVKVTDKSGSSSSSGSASVKRTANSWTVDGQWAFVVDSVNTHYDCNITTDNVAGSVIVVTYSYMNLGYTDNESGLIFSPKSLRVIDETSGQQGKLYPCSHMIKPVELMEKGEICTATAAFSFTGFNYGKKYTVNVSKTPANGNPKTDVLSTAFSMEPGGSWSEDVNRSSEYDKKQKLKAFIEKNGSLDSKTDRFITRTENNSVTQIYYKNATDTLSFVYKDSGNGTVNTINFDMGASDMSSSTIDVNASSIVDSTYGFSGSFDMNFRTHKRTDKCYYSVINYGTGNYNYAKESQYITIFSEKTVAALDSINMLLFESCGLTLKDFGFEAYNG
ncbi:MAG: Ig-like domain-containing protein [Lachnospiraceae bacterium]|nr:Ig-like domain-containing protein [Lachnospiraceae bacterium]